MSEQGTRIPHRTQVEVSRFSRLDGPKLFSAECSCGWFSEHLWSDPEAAEGEAARHESEMRLSA